MKYIGIKDGKYLIRMEIGDKVMECLNSLADKLEITAGTISAIGCRKRPEAGIF